ncbi:MAG: hypothetical protein JKY68_01080, partial [Rhodospirillales bacterium]|nr:hypothetical protein [Rhodospirillales bacterium]
FPGDARAGRLRVLASGRAGDDGALRIHQDAAVMGATLAPGEEAVHGLADNRHAYLVPARGDILVNGIAAAERAGVLVSGEQQITIQASSEAEVVLVDVA